MNKPKIAPGKILWFGMLFLFQTIPSFSQSLTKEFNIKDGLPSTLIYSFAQDKKGFLWISTDNGVARFDGKYFRVFNTNDGLPDNEVLEVLVENDGTVWANTFKQGPVYFDEKTSRFIDPLKEENVKKDFVSLVMYVRKLEDGGTVFFNSSGEFVFKNRKLISPPVPRAFSYSANGHFVNFGIHETRDKNRRFFHLYFQEGKQKDTSLLFTASLLAERVAIAFLDSSRLFVIGDRNTFYKIEKPDPLTRKFKIDSVIMPERPVFFRITDKRVNVSTVTGKIFAYDKKTMQEHYVMEDKGIFYNCILEDAEKNIWAGSVNPNRGLLLYKLNHTEKLNIPDNLIDPSFISILPAKNGKIYAGNYFGNIAEYSSGKFRLVQSSRGDNQRWIRELIEVNGKIFQFSEESSYADFKRRIMLGNAPLVRLKCAKPLNDSIIIAGGVSSAGGLFKINADTEKAKRLNSGLFRISAIAITQNRYVYCGTNDGLFKYDYAKDTAYPVLPNTKLGNQRILAISATPEGLIFAATSSEGIYILKDDRVISRIDYSQTLSQAINCIISSSEKTLWVGSRGGLSKIKYELNGSVLKFDISNFSTTEGLPSGNVTDIALRNDSVFVATDNGIVYLPKNLQVEVEPIKTYLMQLWVNHKTVPLRPDHRYELDYNQRSVTLKLAGINLSGHLKKIQYTFDTTKGWIDIDFDDLTLELSAGTHNLYVRSIDNNRNGIGPVLPIHFHILAPLFLRTWFIIAAAAMVAGIITLVLFRIRAMRQKRKWQQQINIELERNRITADLHDDIGSTLSSLQIYSDIAYKMIDNDREKARGLLAQISAGISKISENIGDIIWSLKGNQTHTLSPASRIKNIVNETLGPTEIGYELHLDGTIDNRITGITSRKNLILIVKEAINNITKYSKASQVTVEMKPDGKHFILSIKDDGIGMNLNERLHQGNGLANIKKRTEEMNGDLNIITSPGNGTEIICRIPITKSSDAVR